MPVSLELYSAVLSFLGGGLLSIDALRARQRIRAESGAKTFLKIMEAHDAKTQIKDDETGAQLDSETALQLWLARQSTRWAWLGFVLMTAGFVLQIMAALTKSPG
jgi:hypothetical protein